MGSAMAPSARLRIGKRKRHRAMAARVPSTRLNAVLIAAMVSELVKASIRLSLLKAFS